MSFLTSLFGGSDTKNTSTSTQNLTTNNDNRQALQDSIGVGAGGSYSNWSSDYSYASDSHDLALADSHNVLDASAHVDNSITYAADAHVLDTLAATMPDTVRALAGYGSDVLGKVGGAVVDLNRDSLAQNARSFDAVVQAGSGMVDKIINASVATAQAGTALAATAVQSFEPVQNKAADSQKYILWGIAGLAVLTVLARGVK